jgi:hypothetical protein
VKPNRRSRVVLERNDSTRGTTGPAKEAAMADDKNKPNKPQEGGFHQDGAKKDEHLQENSKKSLDKKLDHALEETFPTSDPVSVKITK